MNAPTDDLIKVLQIGYGLLSPTLKVADDGMEGNTYIVTNGKHKYVAKLYDDRRRAEALAYFQNDLHVSGLPVPALIETKLGELIAEQTDRVIVLSRFVDGEPIGWGKGSGVLSSTLTAKIAKVVAKMHAMAQGMVPEVELSHTLSVLRILTRSDDDSLSLRKKLSGVDFTSVRTAIIHSDLARENILLNKSRDSIEAIIDFGDAHYDYITYDVATLLTQVYVTKTWGIDFQGIKGFLISYNHLNQLTRTELQTILPLMKLRNEVLLQEIEQRLNENGVNQATLESIKQSLGVKLQLLNKDDRRLKDLILNA